MLWLMRRIVLLIKILRIYDQQSGKRHFIPPPSIPPTRGGKIILLPLDGGGPGGGEKKMGEISVLLSAYISEIISFRGFRA